MFGENFKCNHCEFGFNSGWSHHEAGQFLLCLGCGTHFKAHNPESMWGPHPSKPLMLLKRVYRRKTRSCQLQDTGILLHVSETAKPGAKDGMFYFLHEALIDFDCPSCAQKNSIVETIEGEPSCPKCKSGQLQYKGECIY